MSESTPSIFIPLSNMRIEYAKLLSLMNVVSESGGATMCVHPEPHLQAIRISLG